MPAPDGRSARAAYAAMAVPSRLVSVSSRASSAPPRMGGSGGRESLSKHMRPILARRVPSPRAYARSVAPDMVPYQRTERGGAAVAHGCHERRADDEAVGDRGELRDLCRRASPNPAATGRAAGGALTNRCDQLACARRRRLARAGHPEQRHDVHEPG